MNTQVLNSNLNLGDPYKGYWQSRTWLDWAFAALCIAGAASAFGLYSSHMDVYERAILFGAVPAAILLGWFWRSLQVLMVGVAAVSLTAIWLYGGQIGRADQVFWLKYMLSSQSAILWMSLLFFMSTGFYWLGVFSRGETASLIGSRLCWAAVTMALIGTMVRWAEGYMIGPDIGHIPVSNLYEVFV
ncbi:MAG: c-type cytochrome biogenesis protein CcsB, partial [Betaproteobacteria bacterium]|nr:c-type cytochrome biogenesis protein CcsB [Betaproteobacteria bacterium]MDE2049096.1 c-type cytochrome biogenesis protein CcsB [Betaproteobacteria bacterium]